MFNSSTTCSIQSKIARFYLPVLSHFGAEASNPYRQITNFSPTKNERKNDAPSSLLVHGVLAPLGRMEEGLLVINGISAEQPITGIAQAGKYLALLVKLVIDGTDADTYVGMGLHQLLETIAAGNDAQNVNFGDAPLRSDERDCKRNKLAAQ